MSRYRPPQPKGSKFSTPEGAKRLRDELDFLWRVKRPQVTLAVQEAAAQGDRSENAEYIYGKKKLREIIGWLLLFKKIFYLKHPLHNVGLLVQNHWVLT